MGAISLFREGIWTEQKSRGEIRVHLLLNSLVLLAALHRLAHEGIKSPISFWDYQD